MSVSSQTRLSVETLATRNAAWESFLRDGDSRVRVYTAAGTLIGLPGVGENANRLTFPCRYLVGDALRDKVWIRSATDDEQAADLMLSCDSKWWRVSELQPRTLIHANGLIAFCDEPMGLLGSTMTAFDSLSEVTDVEEVLPADVDGIRTPPTPP